MSPVMAVQFCLRAVVDVPFEELPIRRRRHAPPRRAAEPSAVIKRRRRRTSFVLREQKWLFAAEAPPVKARGYFNSRRLTRRELAFKAELDRLPPLPAVTSFEECEEADIDEPCWQFRCRHHLGVSVNEAGTLKVMHDGLDVDEMRETCSIRAARKRPGKGYTVKETSEIMNLSEEWIRQIEKSAWAKVKAALGDDAARVLVKLRVIE